MKGIIIGAGMAGLMAAHQLQAAGGQVIVLDKGRGVGGRMATRRIEAGVFDHGAQFFTVRDPEFQKYVDAWLSAGVVSEWTRGFANAAGLWNTDAHPRYRGTNGMTGIAKHLAQGLQVVTGERVAAVRIEHDQWQVQLENGTLFKADALVMTPPVPQSLALLDAGNFTLPAEARASLESIRYNPCIAVMALLADTSQVPQPGGVQINSEPVWWIADNMQKGISSVPGITIHAAPEFSRAHWDDEPQEVARLLLEAAHPWIGADVLSFQVHKWRYSQPAHTYPDTCLSVAGPPPIVFAGDAFNGPRVEGAAVSGMAAGAWLVGLNKT